MPPAIGFLTMCDRTTTPVNQASSFASAAGPNSKNDQYKTQTFLLLYATPCMAYTELTAQMTSVQILLYLHHSCSPLVCSSLLESGSLSLLADGIM